MSETDDAYEQCAKILDRLADERLEMQRSVRTTELSYNPAALSHEPFIDAYQHAAAEIRRARDVLAKGE